MSSRSLNEEYLSYQNKMLNLNAFTSHNLVNVLRNIAFAVVLWFSAERR